VRVNRHHIRPQARGGASTADNLIDLDGACHADTHELMDEIEKAPALVVPRRFARQGKLAREGLKRIAEDTHKAPTK